MEGELPPAPALSPPERPSGLSAQVLDYYKRFGRHRDLEQYFSLSTMQGDHYDPSSSMFWRTIKTQAESADTGGKLSEPSSAEICRISINCTLADPSSGSQDGSGSAGSGSATDKQNSGSPPIIDEDNVLPLSSPMDMDTEHRSDLDTSRKSTDLNLDTSLNKPHSPTSSVASQRKLEWDSLADVGYANENERKTNVPSFSTLERLALQQQFSISDEIKNDVSGRPTAHSTPLEEEDKLKSKKNSKKGLLKKTSFSQKGVDVMEIKLDKDEKNVPGNIYFNLTKHISFNVDPDAGSASTSNVKTGNKVEEVKVPVTNVSDAGAKVAIDKEIQTTLSRNIEKEKQVQPDKNIQDQQRKNIRVAAVPVFVNVDMLKQQRYRGLKYLRNKIKNKKKKRSKHCKSKKERVVEEDNKSIPVSELTVGGSQDSEAESFEYMPAHVYHQNTARNAEKENHIKGTFNKASSLESSGGYTTNSSKPSEPSFTKDLEMSIALLNKLVQQRHQDANLKKKVVKEVVQRLISTNYRDDESPTDFLSGLSFTSSLLGLGSKDKSRHHHTTTTTSDTTNSGDTSSRPRRSILRSPSKSGKKSGDSTTRYVQKKANQPSTSSPLKVLHTVLNQSKIEASVNTTSKENTSREKTVSEDEFPKTSSEQIYQCYLKALKKEEDYKKHLKTKQDFIKHKILQKEVPIADPKSSSVKDLINDLTKNNSWHGSGDGALNTVDSIISNADSDKNSMARKQKSHSVFTLSSGNSNRKMDEPTSSRKHNDHQHSSTSRSGIHIEPVGTQHKTQDLQEPTDIKIRDQQSAFRRTHDLNLHYCCCPYHSPNAGKIDSVVQINDQALKVKNCAGTNTDATVGYSTVLKECVRNVALQTVQIPSVSQSVGVFSNASAVNSDDNIFQSEPDNNKLVCFCTEDGKILHDIPGNFVIYKCCKMPYALVQPDSKRNIQGTNSISIQCSIDDARKDGTVYAAQTLVDPSNSSHSGNSNRNVEKHSYLFQEDNSHLIDRLKTTAETTAKINKMTENLQKDQQNNESVQVIKLQKESSIQSHAASTSDSDVSDAIRRDIPRSARVCKDASRLCETVSLSQRRESRHMQTSVSIDPKISEPTLADINIVQENDDAHSEIQSNLGRPFDTKYSDLRENYTKDKTTFENEPVIEHHQTSKNLNHTYKRQKETEPVLEAIVNSNLSSDKRGKSNECIYEETFNESLKTYLNAKDSDIADLDIKQSSITKGINTEVIRKSNTGTSLMVVKTVAPKLDRTDLTGTCSKDQGTDADFEKNVETVSKVYIKSKNRVEPVEHVLDDNFARSSRRASVDKEVGCNYTTRKSAHNNSAVKDSVLEARLSTPSEVPKHDKTFQGFDKDITLKSNSFMLTTSSDPMYVNIGSSGGNIPREKSNNLLQCVDDAVDIDDEINYFKRNSASDIAINDSSNHSNNNTGQTSNYSKNEPLIKSKYTKSKLSPPIKSTCTGSISKTKTTTANKLPLDYCSNNKENRPDNKNMESKNSKSSESKSTGNSTSSTMTKEILMETIKDIIKRYAKEDKPMTVDKRKSRNKYYKEIISKLRYLLQTEMTDTGNTSDSNRSYIDEGNDTLVDTKMRTSEESGNLNKDQKCRIQMSQKSDLVREEHVLKTGVSDKGTQLRNGSSQCKLPRERVTSGKSQGRKVFPSEDSTDVLMSSDMPGTSSDSFTYQIIRKIKRECERFHQKHCQCYETIHIPSNFHYDASSSTSVDRRSKTHCSCRSAHRCRIKTSKSNDKIIKKSIAYNLIIQPSDSVNDSEKVPVKDKLALKDIVVKVPSHRRNISDATTQNYNRGKEEYETGQYVYSEQSPKQSEQTKKKQEDKPVKVSKSSSLLADNEMSSAGEVRKIRFLTVRECLEMNRPDFVNNTNERQRCLRVIQEQRLRQQRMQRKVLSLQVKRDPDLTSVSMTDLRELARRFGEHVRTRRPDAKFLNEREMKQHSRKIYKTLPEVVQKKDKLKKDRIKKTNMIMTNLFNKNLQKKVLRGSVDISNYSTIIQI